MEYRDLYDENRVLTGEKIEKNQPVPKDRFYVTVMVFIENSKGEILLQRRSERKGGKWATTGGHPKSGETSIQGMCTEIEEELGVKVKQKELLLFKTIKTEDDFLDLYYLKKDIGLKDIKMQEEEVQDVKWFTKHEVERLILSEDFFKAHIEAYRFFFNFLENETEVRK